MDSIVTPCKLSQIFCVGAITKTEAGSSFSADWSMSLMSRANLNIRYFPPGGVFCPKVMFSARSLIFD